MPRRVERVDGRPSRPLPATIHSPRRSTVMFTATDDRQRVISLYETMVKTPYRFDCGLSLCYNDVTSSPS